MTATKLTALNAKTILMTGAALSVESAGKCVGRQVEMPTQMANEVAMYTVESVWQSKTDGSIMAWVVPANGYGRHAVIVDRRDAR